MRFIKKLPCFTINEDQSYTPFPSDAGARIFVSRYSQCLSPRRRSSPHCLAILWTSRMFIIGLSRSFSRSRFVHKPHLRTNALRGVLFFYPHSADYLLFFTQSLWPTSNVNFRPSWAPLSGVLIHTVVKLSITKLLTPLYAVYLTLYALIVQAFFYVLYASWYLFLNLLFIKYLWIE